MTRRVPYADPMTEDPREAKLPAWAATALQQLRRHVANEQRRANAARIGGGPEDTNTLLDPYDDTPVRLPKGQRIRFLVGPEPARGGIDRLRDYIDVQVEPASHTRPSRLALHGGGSIVIRPYVTNVVEVTVE